MMRCKVCGPRKSVGPERKLVGKLPLYFPIYNSICQFKATKLALSRLIGLKVYNENENEIRMELSVNVKMKNRGELGNDEEVKSVGPKKSVR